LFFAVEWKCSRVVPPLRMYPGRKVCGGPLPIWDGEKDFTGDHEAACSG
jgi:hypothetical protein